MPSAPPPSPEALLMPNGNPVGKKGSKATIREVPGGKKAADDFFDGLTVGGTENTPSTYPGKRFKLHGGGHVGLRQKSRSGEPTIDVDIPGIPIKKIKFV